jgi:2-oxoglutaroyl-CoA hydrolase
MSTPITFAEPRLATLDGFRVEIDRERERADVILDRPPFNIIEMPQRDQCGWCSKRSTRVPNYG